MAGFALAGVHAWVMFPTIADSRLPQRLFMSFGLDCISTAAMRHAGGVATTKLARLATMAKRTVEVYIVSSVIVLSLVDCVIRRMGIFQICS